MACVFIMFQMVSGFTGTYGGPPGAYYKSTSQAQQRLQQSRVINK